MKNLLKSVIILTAVITFFSSYAHAAEKIFELRTYIPSPFLNASLIKGNVVTANTVKSNEMHFNGLANVSQSCNAGTILYDKDNELFRMCTADNTWAMPDLWSYNEGDGTVYPRDTAWNVGIGTYSPLAKLHVNGGFLVEGNASEDITFPAEGSSGVKFFFHPKKGAIWAGTLIDDYKSYWDDDNIGDNSLTIGADSKAPGKGAIALGERHQAIANNSGIFAGYKNMIPTPGVQGIILSGTNNTIAAIGGVIIAGKNVTIPANKDYSISIGVPIDGKKFTMADKKEIVLHGEKVGINVNPPTATLEIEGSLKLGNKLEKGYAPRGGENMYIISGYVESDGDLSESTTNGVSVTRAGLGTYKITYSAFNFHEMPLLTITPVNNVAISVINVTSLSKNTAIVKCYTPNMANLKDTNFTFLVIGTLSSTKDGALDIQAGEQVLFGQ